MLTVSVIIPAYNAAEFLGEALDSVLRQSYPVREVLVIDDGSTDGTSAIAASYGDPIRVIRTPNQGAALARNTGMDAAASEFVAFLDADDIWEPEKLSQQFERIDNLFRFVYTDTVSFGLEETAGWRMSAGAPLPSGDICAQLIEGNFVGTSTVLLDLELAKRAGGFDPKFRIAQDWILWLRVAQLTHAAYVPAPLVRYRMREGSLGSDVEERLRDCRNVIEEGLTMVRMSKPEKSALRRRALSRSYNYAAILATANRQQAIARRCSFSAFAYNPSTKTLKQVLKSLMGPERVRRFRRDQ